MQKEIHHWFSPSLHKDMEIAIYGHYGFALLMFPTADAGYTEYEEKGVIDSIGSFIEHGIVKVFVINSINSESWLNNWMSPVDKSRRHYEYNVYVENEVVQFIFNHCNGFVPVITTGASFGALHAANTFFRKPELFAGTIALSGTYELHDFTDGYTDENVYFNSPISYLGNLHDSKLLHDMRDNKKIIIATGQGDYEDPASSVQLSDILKAKKINHWLDLWGHDMVHDWPTWKLMYPYFISKIKDINTGKHS